MRYLSLLFTLMLASHASAGAFQCRDNAGQVVFQQFPCTSVTTAIEPVQTARIDAAQVQETLRRYHAAVQGNDQRARASFFSDDFLFSVYASDRFDYVRNQQDRQEAVTRAGLLEQSARQLDSGGEWQVEALAHGHGQYLVRAADGSRLQRLEFALVDGRLLIRRWDVALQ